MKTNNHVAVIIPVKEEDETVVSSENH